MALWIPDRLAELARDPSGDGAAWLERLPGLVASAVERWSLQLGPPYPDGFTAYCAPATRPDGSVAVLKVMFPHREGMPEAAALAFYGGDGVVRLLEHDPADHCVLLERCRPGTPLSAVVGPDRHHRILDVATGLLRRLWRPAEPGHPFEALGALTADWSDDAAERFDRLQPGWDPGLVAEAIRLLRDLPRSSARAVLLHQDFHPDNVLAAEREPWLVIDPKPVVGDPHYDPVPLVVQLGDQRPEIWPDGAVAGRVREVAARLDLEADRLAAWGVARMTEVALWDLHTGDRALAEQEFGWAAHFAACC
jgi:streptomycin 6-kinase